MNVTISVNGHEVPTLIAYSHTTLGPHLPDAGFLLIIPHTTSYDNVEQLNADIRYLNSSYSKTMHGQVNYNNDDYDVHAYSETDEMCVSIFNTAITKCENGSIFN